MADDSLPCEHETRWNTFECVIEDCPDRVYEYAPEFWVCWSGPSSTTTTTLATTTTAAVEPVADDLPVDPFAAAAILLAAMWSLLWPF